MTCVSSVTASGVFSLKGINLIASAVSTGNVVADSVVVMLFSALLPAAYTQSFR